MDAAATLVRAQHPSARGGLFAFIDDDAGLFGRSFVRKTVDVQPGATVYRVALDYRVPGDGSGDQDQAAWRPLVEIVVDVSSRTAYMVQFQQGMPDALRLLNHMCSTKRTEDQQRHRPFPAEAPTAMEEADTRPLKKQRLEAEEGKEGQEHTSVAEQDLDDLTPQAGRFGLGFKQLLLLFTNEGWSYAMAGSVHLPGNNARGVSRIEASISVSGTAARFILVRTHAGRVWTHGRGSRLVSSCHPAGDEEGGDDDD